MPTPSSALHRYAAFIVGFTVLLICWGAAVTTEDVGLAVPDWPLCFNRVNPEGWWKLTALLLEHGHRWLATILSGFVLIALGWLWQRHRQHPAISPRLTWIEFGVLVVSSVALVALVAFNRSPRVEPFAQSVCGWAAVGLGLACVAWIAWSLSARKWPLALKLVALAWVVVGAQAILGGLRVTDMSDALGIFHGTLGQILFCLLLFLALVTSPRWPSPPFMAAALRGRFVRLSAVFFTSVAIQLVLGATIRHTQRRIPAALDVLTTGGKIFPGFADTDLLAIFLHKAWAVVVTVLGCVLAWQAARHLREHAGLRRLAFAVPVLLGVQVTLGIFVLLTMDRYKLAHALAPGEALGTGVHLSPVFWVTNSHVVTGLSLLACSFALLVKTVASVPHRGMLAAADSRSGSLA